MKYSKTRKGNPSQLSVKQHVFPVASLARFVPDQFGTLAVVPVTPKTCLVASCGDVNVALWRVRELNQKAVAAARALLRCPVVFSVPGIDVALPH